MTAYALLFTLAAIGISETAYLISTRRHHKKPVCVVGGSTCQIVLDSKYNHLLGVHNDLLGFVFYLFITVILGLIVVGIEPLDTWALLAQVSIYAAGLFSIFLVYLQKFVIKSWCFWCLMSATTTWLMAFIVFLIS